jgi:uncharacterized coiled-coil protein SlyX
MLGFRPRSGSQTGFLTDDGLRLRPPCRANVSRRYLEQAPDRHAIASTTSSMDRPAVVDISVRGDSLWTGRTTKGLEVTQQQAVDQLQVVQDQLIAQQIETKKLSAQIATLTEKLDAHQQSVANIPAPSVAALLPTPKAPSPQK